MLLTLSELSRRLGLSEPTTRRLVKDWPAIRIGKRRRWPQSEMEKFVRSAVRPDVQQSNPAAGA